MATANPLCPKCSTVLRLFPQSESRMLICVRCGSRFNHQQQQQLRKGRSFNRYALESKGVAVCGAESSPPDLPLPLVCKNVNRLLRRPFFRRGKQQSGPLPPLQVLGNAGSLNVRSKNTSAQESAVLPVPHLASVERRNGSRSQQCTAMEIQHLLLPPLQQQPPQPGAGAVSSDSVQRQADGEHLCLPAIDHQVQVCNGIQIFMP